MDWSDLFFFLLWILGPLIAFLVISLAIMSALIGGNRPKNKGMVKWVGWSVVGSISGLWLAFIWLAIVSHMDIPDLVGPAPETKLAEWSEVCESTLGVGTSLLVVEAYIESLEFYAGVEKDGPWDGRSFFRHFRQDNWVQYQVLDMDVRNWSMLGEIDIQTTINLHDDVVSSCQARIFKHGR